MYGMKVYGMKIKYWEENNGNVVFSRIRHLRAGMIPTTAIHGSDNLCEIKEIKRILNDTWRELPNITYSFKLTNLTFYDNGAYVEYYTKSGEFCTEVIFPIAKSPVAKYVYDTIKATLPFRWAEHGNSVEFKAWMKCKEPEVEIRGKISGKKFGF